MQPAELPESLADMPPGPALAAALATVDLPRLTGYDMVTVLAARYRLLAHEQARVLEALVEVGRRDPDDPAGLRRLDAVGPWASGEIAAALTLTGVAADRELSFADGVVTRLPAVFHALCAGAIDRSKAWLFADHLADLPARQIAAICAALLPAASTLTTGQLRARLVRMLHDIDPDHARRRYHRAVRERAVVGYLAPDGTITITATGLPTDEAAVACARLDALAHTIQRSGHPGLLGQIQTDLFLGMLDGTLHHLTEAEIIAAFVSRIRPEDSEHDDGGCPETSTAPATSNRAPTPSPTTKSAKQQGAASARRTGTPTRVGLEVRVGLATLLSLDERCGEVAGIGPVQPGIARRLVAAQYRGAEWRFAITDDDGRLLLASTTRCRPSLSSPEQGRCRGGIVELQVEAATLARLAADPARGPWSGVIADLARQFAECTRGLADIDRRPGARFARARLARHIEVRDRTCCFPGCRRPARTADKDHTREYAAGGPTSAANIDPLCDRHHRYKSLGWWALAQPAPGRFRWTSPLSCTYRVRGEPIRPPTVSPHPRAVATNRASGSVVRRQGPILRRSPPPARRDAPLTAVDDPPF